MTEPRPILNFAGENTIHHDITVQAVHPPLGKGIRPTRGPSLLGLIIRHLTGHSFHHAPRLRLATDRHTSFHWARNGGYSGIIGFLAKLLINSLSIPILLLHTRLIREVATAAAKTGLSPADLHDQRLQLVTISLVALLALLTATTLSIYKPRGLTPFGQRNQSE